MCPVNLNRAYDINDSVQIVGWSSRGAYIYEDGVVTNLSTLIPVDSGASLATVTVIGNGGWIAVNGRLGGRFQVGLLRPVE